MIFFKDDAKHNQNEVSEFKLHLSNQKEIVLSFTEKIYRQLSKQYNDCTKTFPKINFLMDTIKLLM
nr:unnamed protein product [Callosobruchus chinensis]